jgi:hypothetical protein
MTIELSEDQYKSLLKLAFLGQWVANSFRYERIEEFDDVEQHLMSFAKKAELKDTVVYNKKVKRWFPTKEFDLEMHFMIDAYQDDYFYEELVYKLAHRDAVKKHGVQYETMSIEERMKADDSFLDKYYAEIEENDVENIGIVHNPRTDLKIN